MRGADNEFRASVALDNRWWLWPGALIGLAVLCLGVSLLFEPSADEFCYVLGHRFGDTCQFTVWTGYPCPQCGMTRSWVWAARLQFGRAFAYNPAGMTLFLWIQAAGLIGFTRIISRNPRRFTVSPSLLFGWACFWFVVLYVSLWFGRLAGINSLP